MIVRQKCHHLLSIQHVSI